MDRTLREEILRKVRPDSLWAGEPALGCWYTQDELNAAMDAMTHSMSSKTGFYAREYVERFEAAFADYIGTTQAVAVNGGGTGMDMALMCLELNPGDEVISCAINFPGTHLSIIGQGAKLVLCEPEPHTFNIDAQDVEKRITPKTRAIVATHMNGLSVDMDALLEVAERRPHPKYGPIKIIGDAARACGAAYKGTKVGKKGWINVFSFQSKKLMTTLGEGGMCLTDDLEAARKLRSFRAFGDGVGWGTNYKLTKVQAAVGLVQLRRLEEMNAQRIHKAQQRSALLEEIPELQLPTEPAGFKHVYYLYTVMVKPAWAGERRDELIRIMREKFKIGCVIGNPPSYQLNRLIREQTAGQKLPLSDELGLRLFCPSLHPLMTDEENRYVAAALSATVDRLQS